MASYSILDWFVKVSGYRTDSSQGAIEFTVADLTDSILPSGYKLFEQLTLKTVSGINYTVSTGSGNTNDDIIIAHLSSYLADNIYNKVRIDPELGNIENRHWAVAERMIKSIYGVFDEDVGEFVFPGQIDESSAATFFYRVDSSFHDPKTHSTTSAVPYSASSTSSFEDNQ